MEEITITKEEYEILVQDAVILRIVKEIYTENENVQCDIIRTILGVKKQRSIDVIQLGETHDKN